jgi:hypothetical protein
MTRIATYLAIKKELANKLEEGWAIRHALTRIGSLMRVHSRYAIGSLLGIAITAIATSKPRGVDLSLPAVPKETEKETKARVFKRLDAYATYMREIGHSDEARYAQEEITAGWEVKDTVRHGLELSAWSTDSIARLAVWWALCVITLSNLFGLLTLAAFAGVASRIRPRKEMTVLRVLLAVATTGGFIGWQYRILTHLLQIDRVFSGYNAQTYNPYIVLIVGCLMVIFGLCVPLSLGLNALFLTGKSRVTTPEGWNRMVRTVSLPFASGLLVIYGLLQIPILFHEARISYGIKRTCAHEGRYLADLLGKRWPGLPKP